MSARQPFTPFRPVSRAASAQQSSNTGPDSRVELSSVDEVPCPLVQSTGKESSQAPQMVQTKSAIIPHLNLSALIPSKSKSLQAHNVRKAKAVDGGPQLPLVNQQTIQISTPGSTSQNFIPSATGHITVTTFDDHSRLPVAEHKLARISYDSPVSNDPYSTRSPDLSESYSYQNSLKTRMHSSRSLEQITEASEDDEGSAMHQEHGFDFHSLNENDLSVKANPGFQNLETTFFEQETELSHDVSHGRALRRTSKKRPRKPDEDEDYGLIDDGKRFKINEDHFSPHATSVNHRGNKLQSTHRSQAVATLHEESLLNRIIGPDADMRADKKTEQYENARRKWVECSLEEWRDGAEELSLKFTDVLNIIKDRMTVKLTAYAGMHATLDAHKKKLKDRNDELKKAQNSLVKNSGSVVGGNIHENFSL